MTHFAGSVYQLIGDDGKAVKRMKRFGYRFVLLAAILVMSLSACLPLPSEVIVLANEDFYQSRPEPEGVWQGTFQLDARDGEHPPNWIAGLQYKLETTQGLLYLDTRGRVVPALERLLGREVEVVGKLMPVDVMPGEIIYVGKVTRPE